MHDPGKFILYYMVQDNPDDNTSIFNLVNIGYDQRYLLGSHREEIIALAKLPIHDGHVQTILAYHDPKYDCDKLDCILRSIDREHCETFYPDGYRLPVLPNSCLFRATDLDVYTCGVVNHELPTVWVNNINAIAFAMRDPRANESSYETALEQVLQPSNMCVLAKIGAPHENSNAAEKALFESYKAAALINLQKNERNFSSQEISTLNINRDLLKFIAREINLIFIILVASENGAGYIIEGEFNIHLFIS